MCEDSAPTLPVDLVAQVLLLIDQKQRLNTCALVNHEWRKAANLACKGLVCTLRSAAQCQALSSWLHKNSSCISSIEVASQMNIGYFNLSKLAKLQLPSAGLQLQALRLKSCSLNPAMAAASVAPDGSAIGTVSADLLAGLTALKALQLEDCLVNIDHLGSCKHLQHLKLHLAAAAPSHVGELEATLAAALPQLQHLTFLS